jgi:hypothetical protein
MSQVKHKSLDNNDDDIRSNECSERTLETASIGSTIGDGNAQGNEDNSMNALLEVPFLLREKIELFFRSKRNWKS